MICKNLLFFIRVRQKDKNGNKQLVMSKKAFEYLSRCFEAKKEICKLAAAADRHCKGIYWTGQPFNSETRNAALNLLKFALGAIGKKLIYDTTENLIFGNLGSRFLRCQKFKQRKNGNSPFHRFILLKLCKQIGGTNYQPILAANEA